MAVASSSSDDSVISDLRKLKDAISTGNRTCVLELDARYKTIIAPLTLTTNNPSYSNMQTDGQAETLAPTDIPFSKVRPVKTTGNGDCLFNATSLYLKGKSCSKSSWLEPVLSICGKVSCSRTPHTAVSMCRAYSSQRSDILDVLCTILKTKSLPCKQLVQSCWARACSTSSDSSSKKGKPNGDMEKSTFDEKTHPGYENYFNKEIYRKIKKKQSEQFFYYTENNFMDMYSAKIEFLLDDNDLASVRKIKRQSPFSSREYGKHTKIDDSNFIEVSFTKDLQEVAIQKWGSLEKLMAEKERRKYAGYVNSSPFQEINIPSFYQNIKESFGKDTGAVVMFAFLMNLCNACFKGVVWALTGSPSMFSEFMHSCGDTLNQMLLAFGKYLSMKNPDANHPYGYRNHIHIWSIASGLVIFSLGCGLTMYHGIMGLWYPKLMDMNSLYQAIMVLTGSFLTEGASLAMAINQVRKDAKTANMSVYRYVKEGEDPLVNVVLLEDSAGVLGVVVCGAAMTASVLMGNPHLDAIGSLVISGMLGLVSGFLFKSNSDKLLGKALPYEDEIKKYMESDRFINAVLDNKTLDMGDQSRFKSEVVLDARLITQHFLNTEVDQDAMFVKWQSVKTSDDMGLFLEEFGSQLYDQIVAHVDRKERDIKKKFPEIRHIDIEPS